MGKKMKVAIGSDHAGFPLKQELIQFLNELDVEIFDVGTNSNDPVDYPDYASLAALKVQSLFCERAIIICGSGVGASIVANKFKGIRAAVCHDTYSAHQGVEHDDMNVLVLGGRIIGSSLAKEIVKNFLQSEFSNEERHVRRLKKILSLE
jgi:RpiB/LacA/LacB family sugar-phosphate isomerase